MRLLRRRWVHVLAIGMVLFVASDATLRFTGDINYFPTVMILGTFLVPSAFVAFFYEQESSFDRGVHGSILPTLFWCALLGGLIGTLAAGTLEHSLFSPSSLLDLVRVGVIEESTKLIVPVAIYVIMRDRFRSELDGLLLGVVAGMAFAVLESMGYELAAFVNSHGSVDVVDQTTLVRGVLSPAGHASWTGIITATLWGERERTGKAFSPLVIPFFLVSALLHSSWDYASTARSVYVVVPSYIGIAVISLGLLGWRLREAKRSAGVRVCRPRTE